MKSKDIVIGAAYAYKIGPGRYNTAESVKVVRVGRYITTRDDEQESKYAPIMVVVEAVDAKPGRGTYRWLATPGQIIGTWAEVGPQIDAENRAKQERVDAVRREQAENRRRWTELKKKAGTLGIDLEIHGWNLKESKNSFPLAVMEKLVELAEKGIDS